MDRAELQALQLAMSLCLGLGLGFFYDIYRVWFRKVQVRDRLLAGVGDILWWVLALVIAMVGLYRINGLELRFPVLALAAAGVCVYMGFLSPVIFPLLWRLLGWLWRAAKWLGRCLCDAMELLLCPLVWLVELGFGILGLLGCLLRLVGRILGGAVRFLLRPFGDLVLYIKKHQKKVDFDVDFSEGNDI